MKRLLSLIIALALCACSAAACAETTVQAKDLEAYDLELNEKTNTFVLTDRSSGLKYVTDTELRKLSEGYQSIRKEDKYFTAANEDLHTGLLDSQGKLVVPLEYGDIEIINDKWIAGVRLVVSENSEENPDYKAWFGSGSYMIDTVDLYYAGEKKGTVTRSEWKRAKAFGDYLSIEDREGNQTFYNKDFVKSGAEAKYAYEYTDDYSTKTITHNGSNQAAFTAGCTLTPDEVVQSVWVNSDKKLLDLQGNVLADLSAYKYVQVDAETNMLKVENDEGKCGLVDSTGKEIVPCQYDRLSYSIAGALESGYIYAENEEKSGFVSLSTGKATGFTFTKDAGNQRATYILVDDAREGKILISAAAGELTERFKDANATFTGKGDACMFATVKGQDDNCRVIGQLGEDILPGITFKGIYDAKMSEDGTLILLPGEERGHYTLYTVSYDPDLSAIPEAGTDAEEETWTCENGHTGLTGNFCPECGARKPD